MSFNLWNVPCLLFHFFLSSVDLCPIFETLRYYYTCTWIRAKSLCGYFIWNFFFYMRGWSLASLRICRAGDHYHWTIQSVNHRFPFISLHTLTSFSLRRKVESMTKTPRRRITLMKSLKKIGVTAKQKMEYSLENFWKLFCLSTFENNTMPASGLGNLGWCCLTK